MTEAVGVVGAGRMGLPLIGHLARKGFATWATDVNVSRRVEVEQRGAGWAATTPELAARCDVVLVCVGYDHELRALLRDLRGMGETNVLIDRLKQPTRRAIFARAAALYQERFADREGRLRATFQVVFLTGWAPHESQQQPARRGSGQTSLKDVFRPS